METIIKGDLTNKGIVHMIDKPCESISDPIVRTSKGIFRMSELEKIEKVSKPATIPLKELVDFKTVMSLDFCG